MNESTPGYFPFTVNALDGSPTFADMSNLNTEPAGAAGRVTNAGGHFVDGHGARLRLMGTNLTFAGAFPDKAVAPLLAAHLRKMGFNVIRFHHMDTNASPKGIYKKGFTQFDPAQVDKLDWLMYQLKQCGIYSNVNLHVGRTYPGIPTDIAYEFRYGKGLDNFYPPFIDSQKTYAQQLLAHTNPYTSMTYAQDPAVIVVELNNENSLTNCTWDGLRNLPDPFQSSLTGQWRSWLAQRYGTTPALQDAWSSGSQLLGAEILPNGDFLSNASGWTIQQSHGADVNALTITDLTVTGGIALQVDCVTTGTGGASDQQLFQKGLNLTNGQKYTFHFWARADQPRDMTVSVMLDQSPWTNCGLSQTVTLGTEWQEFTFAFTCVNAVANHCRAGFNFKNTIGTFWLAKASLRPGFVYGLPAGQSLEANNIPLPPANAGEPENADFYELLSQTERDYVTTMTRYLKQDLGVQALITCTQISYGDMQGVLREGTLSDYVDMHAYWQHPSFPGTPWDPVNWFITNTPMSASANGGTYPKLAWYRMAGKPFTLSENNHPAPSDYSSEMLPMLGSFAAFQDWDGFYQFQFASRASAAEYASTKIGSYFELCSQPGHYVLLPAAAIMFRTGAVRAGVNPLLATVRTGDLSLQLAHNGATYPPADGTKESKSALQRRAAFQLSGATGGPIVPPVSASQVTSVSVTDTGEITWDKSLSTTQGIYTVNAPAVRAATGHVGKRIIALGDATINVTSATNNWATVAICALDSKPLSQSSRMLVSAVGRVENADMGWNATRTSVGNQWGRSPTICEGIVAAIHLPAGARVWALDGTGTATASIPVKWLGSGETEFQIGPQNRTLWYGAEKTTPTLSVTVNTLTSHSRTPVLRGTVADTGGSGVASVLATAGGYTTTATVNGGAWTARVPSALAPGVYDVQATATDNAGNSAEDPTTNELIVLDKASSVQAWRLF